MRRFSTLLLFIAVTFSANLWAFRPIGKVVHVSEKVFLFRNDEKLVLEKDDLLSKGDKIQTMEKSIAIISFGSNYASTIKISPKTQVLMNDIISDESKKESEHGIFTTVSLKIGAILIKFINKLQNDNLRVKATNSSFSIRGTEFFVHTNRHNQSLLLVKEGVVGGKHDAISEYTNIAAGRGLIISPAGKQIEISKAKLIDSINWNLDPYSGEVLHPDNLDKQIEKYYEENIGKYSAKANGYGGSELIDQCNHGESSACIIYAQQLMKRQGDHKKKSLDYLRKACELNDIQGCIQYSRAEYEFGDKALGKKYLIYICDLNNFYGCYTMWEVEKAADNVEAANSFFKKAHKLLQESGNIPEEKIFLDKVCSQNNSTACYELGNIYLDSGDNQKALSYSKKACDLGDNSSCSNYGFILQNEGKLEEAKIYYQKACDAKISTGCYNLACAYAKLNDQPKAFVYLEMAFTSGYTNYEHIINDDDLKEIKDTTKFKDLLEKYNIAKKESN